MAEHPDIVEAVIATSTDESPPSRRKVIAAIRDHKTSTMVDEARQGLTDAGITIDTDPVSIATTRRRTEIVAGLLGRLADLQTYSDRFDYDTIAAAVIEDRLSGSIVDDIESAVNWLETLHQIITSTERAAS